MSIPFIILALTEKVTWIYFAVEGFGFLWYADKKAKLLMLNILSMKISGSNS
jgi:hypothetical protein